MPTTCRRMLKLFSPALCLLAAGCTSDVLAQSVLTGFADTFVGLIYTTVQTLLYNLLAP